MKQSITILFCATMLIAQSAIAEEIQIIDCAGVTRAMLNTDSELGHTVSVTLTKSGGALPVAVELPLKNTNSGEILKALSQDGVATFNEVSNGIWSACPLPQNVSISNITISPIQERSALSVATIGSAAVGSAALIGVALSGSESSASGETTGAPTIIAQGGGTTNVGSLSGPAPTKNTQKHTDSVADKDTKCTTAGAQINDNPCRVGEKPVPVSPFS